MRSASHSENQLTIPRHFYRAHACFVTYFLMTEKFQPIRQLAYIPSLGPGGGIGGGDDGAGADGEGKAADGACSADARLRPVEPSL